MSLLIFNFVLKSAQTPKSNLYALIIKSKFQSHGEVKIIRINQKQKMKPTHKFTVDLKRKKYRKTESKKKTAKKQNNVENLRITKAAAVKHKSVYSSLCCCCYCYCCYFFCYHPAFNFTCLADLRTEILLVRSPTFFWLYFCLFFTFSFYFIFAVVKM